MRSLLALLALSTAVHATIIYSGVQNVSAPVTPDGVYVNIITGATTYTLPGTWGTAPWFNPFFGGVAIYTPDHLRPVVDVSDVVRNLAYLQQIDGTSLLALGENASSSHTGTGAGQFTLGTPGYVGFGFESAPGGPTLYGWAQIVVNNSSPGLLIDWAYDDAGQPVWAGSVVPEPSRFLYLLLAAAVLVMRRSGKKKAGNL